MQPAITIELLYIQQNSFCNAFFQRNQAVFIRKKFLLNKLNESTKKKVFNHIIQQTFEISNSGILNRCKIIKYI